MSEANELERAGGTVPSANDRFKARWNRRVAGSTGLGAALHVALFLLAGWTVIRPDLAPSLFPGRGLHLISTEASEPEGAGTPAEPEPLAEAAPPEGVGDEAEPTGGANAGGAALDARLERLRDRTALAPRIVEREPVREGLARAETGQAEADREIGGEARAPDLTILPAADSLQLDRLASLRPEIVVVMPSAWVLLRNPAEIEAYLRRSDRDAVGSVNVTLWIDQRGSVEWAEISKSSGRRDLDELALAVFNEVAVFRPAREEGVSVSRSVTFALNFPW
jgi:TonB family protein